MAQAGTCLNAPSEGPEAHPPQPTWVGPHILQAGAVLVLVQVMLLPEAQQVVEVVEQEAGVFLAVLHALQQPQVQGQPLFPAGQHQNHEAGVEAADVLLQGPRPAGLCVALGGPGVPLGREVSVPGPDHAEPHSPERTEERNDSSPASIPPSTFWSLCHPPPIPTLLGTSPIINLVKIYPLSQISSAIASSRSFNPQGRAGCTR